MKNRSNLLAFFMIAIAIATPSVAFAVFPTQSATLVKASSQYFSAPTSVSIATPAGAWTFEAWIKPTSVSVFQGAFAITTLGGAANNTANMLIDDGTSGKVSCQTTNSTGGITKEVFTTNTISAGAWTHMACTFDGSNLRIYINGVLDNTLAASMTRTGATGTFYLGAYYNGVVSDSFGGSMVLARWWSSTRTASEILNNYCTQLGATTALQAEWTLNNTLNDNSGNSNTLTNVNSATFAADVPATCAAIVTPSGFGWFSLFGDWL